MLNIGLRIDVDTLRGTTIGVPNLVKLLSQYQITGTFYFSLGPDNMGRHVWRLLKPKFLMKMINSKAASLYGWQVLLSGTFWPGLSIAKHGKAAILLAQDHQHEIGLHAWDHHAWQKNAGIWSYDKIFEQIQLGYDELSAITGKRIVTSAVAGWRATPEVVQAKAEFPFTYNSDCRGAYPFIPKLLNGELGAVQIPVSLPTYDEVIGREVDDAGFNDYILDKITNLKGVPVYTIHAEVEGMTRIDLFEDLLKKLQRNNMTFTPLSALLPAETSQLPIMEIQKGYIEGREGWLAVAN